jgi:hypothetical protein
MDCAYHRTSGRWSCGCRIRADINAAVQRWLRWQRTCLCWKRIDATHNSATLRSTKANLVLPLLFVFGGQPQRSDEGSQGYSHLARFGDCRINNAVGRDRSLPGSHIRQAVKVVDAAHDFAQYEKFVLLEFISVEHCRPQRFPDKTGPLRRHGSVRVDFGHEPPINANVRATWSRKEKTFLLGAPDSRLLPSLTVCATEYRRHNRVVPL